MKAFPSFPRFLTSLAVPLFFTSVVGSANAAAAVDTAFVGKVSQGGRFEVEAGKLAQDKASSTDVKDFANQDVSDHDAVNAELKTIADGESIPLAPDLNAMFTSQLHALGALSGAAFDHAYVKAMAKIHKKDEGIFAREARATKDPQWKAFASKTDGIVKGHITILKGLPAKLK